MEDELVLEIGRALVEEAGSGPWEDCVFVGEVREDGHSGYGFLYGPGDKVESSTPSVFDSPIYERLHEIHDAMGEDWQFCVVRVHRASGKMSIDFEYDPDKWKMSPSRLEKLKKELRPKA